jgi:NDP-sugar pyrophosphorylase family protein
MLPVAILAGGLATRLGSITKKIPKSLVEVSGVPFIFHQLARLKNEGITKVVLCVGHLGEQILNAVGDGSDFGLSIEYSCDGPVLLGTGGTLKKAVPKLGNKFFVMYGDSYLRCNFKHVQLVFEKSNKKAIITVINNDGRWDKSNTIFDNGTVVIYDKEKPHPYMDYIDYGLSIVCSDILDNKPEIFDLATIFNELSIAKQLGGVEVYNKFYEIGSVNGLKEAKEYLAAI